MDLLTVNRHLLTYLYSCLVHFNNKFLTAFLLHVTFFSWCTDTWQAHTRKLLITYFRKCQSLVHQVISSLQTKHQVLPT